MPSLFLTSRLPIISVKKKRNSRMKIADTGRQFSGGPGASSLPTLTAAPTSNTGPHLSACDEQKTGNDGSRSEDARNTIWRVSSSDFVPIGKHTSGDTPPSPVPSGDALALGGEAMSSPPPGSRHLTLGSASPSRIARKASKIGSNIVSDVKAGSASLLGVMSRRSQQSQMDSERERVERLGEMGILSTSSTADRLGMSAGETFSFYGNGCDKEEKDVGCGRHMTPSGTKGIMKRTATTCPEIQVQPSRSTMNPNMVDPKPSVRFTLDLPPKLDLDLTLSGSALDKDLEKSTEVESEVQSTSGAWAERTAAAVLDKSRDVDISLTCIEKDPAGYCGKRKYKESPPEMPEDIERGGPTTSKVVGAKDSTIQCSTGDVVTTAGSQTAHMDQISTLDPIEPGLTIYRLEDLANAGSRLPSKLSSRRESSVCASVLSTRTSSSSTNSRRSSVFDVRRQARADIPASLIKMKVKEEIEEIARSVSARKKTEGKGLGEFRTDNENDRLNDCVSA